MRIRIEIDTGKVWGRFSKLATINNFLLLYFAFHMLQIAFPSDGSMVFDEAYYTKASLATLMGIAANAEHPPLPKIIGALGIALFGNNWFGWRFPVVLMQVAALYLFYLVAKRFLGDRWALFGTVLLGLDTVFFIHGGTLLIDMPSFLFSFAAIELYFRKRYTLSAGSAGLALLAREMSIFIIGGIAVYHFVSYGKSKLKPALKIGLRYLLIALLVFGMLLWAYDLKYLPPSSSAVSAQIAENVLIDQSGSPVSTLLTTIYSTSNQLMWNPVQHVLFIYNYHGPHGIVINESYAPFQYAWNWIIPNDPYNVPTYYRVDVGTSNGGVPVDYVPIWYRAQPDVLLWDSFLPVMIGLIWLIVRHMPRTERAFPLFILSGLILNFTPWLLLSILVRRIGFNYYFIWTLPFVALGLAYCLKATHNLLIRRTLIAVYAMYAIASFLWFFPVRPIPLS